MRSVLWRLLAVAGALAGLFFVGVSPALAGGVPAPVLGVTGPAGIAAAGVVYGGYLLYKRYRR